MDSKSMMLEAIMNLFDRVAEVEKQLGIKNTVDSINNDDPVPLCPDCGGRMWDNRLTKRNPKAPDFKCRDRQCNKAIWLKPKED